MYSQSNLLFVSVSHFCWFSLKQGLVLCDIVLPSVNITKQSSA